MIEWDDASYDRKFRGQFIVFKYKGKEVRPPLPCYVSTINRVEARIIKPGEGQDTDVIALKYWEPEYTYFPSGFITYDVVVMRKQVRQWKTGLSTETHYCLKYDTKYHTFRAMGSSGFSLHLLAHANDGLTYMHKEWDPEAAFVRGYGPISRSLYLGSEQLYYYNLPLAVRSGKREFKLLNHVFRQEVEDALQGHKCQLLD